MKIRFDENISHRVFGAVNAVVANREGFEVSHNRNSGDGGKPDPDWMKGFAAQSGTAIISGDYRILQNPVDLIAYVDSGLTSVFPPTAFKHLNGYGRAALIIRWWPTIVEKLKDLPPATAWRFPMAWTPDPTKFEALRDPRIERAKADGQIQSAPEVLQFRPRSGGR